MEVKKIEDMDLEQVSGGDSVHDALVKDPGWLWQARFIFDASDVKILEQHGVYNITPNKPYARGELNDKGISGSTKGEMTNTLRGWGIKVREV